MPAGDHLTRPRVVGLAGTTLMGAGSYGAGALPGPAPDAGWVAGTSWGYRLGLLSWFAGLVLLAVAWWRLGDPSRRSLPSWRALALTGALWALPLLLAPPAGSRDVYAYACQGALWLDGVDPYRTGVGPGGCPWAESVPALWRDTATPYGPLAVLLSGAVVAVARLLTESGDGPVAAPDDVRLIVAAALLRVLAVAGALLVARYLPRLARSCGVDPAAAGWLALLSPVVAVHLVSGAHNDALMAGLVLAALAIVAVHPSGTAPLRAGGLLGLAVAVKVTAVLAVPFAILLAAIPVAGTTSRSGRTPTRADVRRTGGLAAAVRRLGPAAVTVRRVGPAGVMVLTGAAVTFAGLTALTGLDLGWVWALSDTGRLTQWTSAPTGVGMAVGYALWLAGRPDLFDPAVTVARVVGLIVLAVLLVTLVVRAWRAVPRIPPGQCPAVPAADTKARTADTEAPTADTETLTAGAGADTGATAVRRQVLISAGLALTVLALLSPVFYPWYAITAVAVLAAGITDRRHRRWLAATMLVLGFLVLPDGLGLATLTKVPGALLDLGLVLVLVVIAVRRVRSGHRPGRGDPGDAHLADV